MSGPIPKIASFPAANAAMPTAGDVLGLFSPAALERLIVEGFALAFERRMQGTSMEVLIEALQLAADLRVFKESLSLTGEQVARMLQISERTFHRYKEENKLAVDPHIGPGSPRYSLWDVLRLRTEKLQEAAAVAPVKATVRKVSKR